MWNLKDKQTVHILNNIVPKCNSFQTAKVYGTPSFHSKTGEYLAYPHNKEVVVVERSTWKELFKLKSDEIKRVILTFFNLTFLVLDVYLNFYNLFFPGIEYLQIF